MSMYEYLEKVYKSNPVSVSFSEFIDNYMRETFSICEDIEHEGFYDGELIECFILDYRVDHVNRKIELDIPVIDD